MQTDLQLAVSLILSSVYTVEGADRKELWEGLKLINGAAARRERQEREDAAKAPA